MERYRHLRLRWWEALILIVGAIVSVCPDAFADLILGH